MLVQSRVTEHGCGRLPLARDRVTAFDTRRAALAPLSAAHVQPGHLRGASQALYLGGAHVFHPFRGGRQQQGLQLCD